MVFVHGVHAPFIQDGPLLDIYANGVKTNPYKWSYKWVTGVITRISGVITLLITGRGPPCTIQKAMQVGVIFWSQQMNRELSGQFAPLEHCLDAAQIGSRESINHEGSDESSFVQAGKWWHLIHECQKADFDLRSKLGKKIWDGLLHWWATSTIARSGLLAHASL